MPLYEVLAYPDFAMRSEEIEEIERRVAAKKGLERLPEESEKIVRLSRALEEAKKETVEEFAKLPKEQRTPYKRIEILRAKLAEKGIPFVYARVNAASADEAERFARDALAMTGALPEEPMLIGTAAVAYPLADTIFIDPPPEDNPATLQPEHLILGAAASLWLAALLLGLER